MVVDDKQIDTDIQAINAEIEKKRTEIKDLKQLRVSYVEIKKVQNGWDDAEQTIPHMQKPQDRGTFAEMTDARRQELFDAATAKKSALGL